MALITSVSVPFRHPQPFDTDVTNESFPVGRLSGMVEVHTSRAVTSHLRRLCFPSCCYNLARPPKGLILLVLLES